MKVIIGVCLFCCLLFSALPAPAQQNPIDSLEAVLPTLPLDTNRVIVLCKLSSQYRKFTNDSIKSLTYAQQALEMSRKLLFTFGMGQSYNQLGSYYYRRNLNQQALHYFTKSLEYYQQAGRKVGIGMGYGNLAMVYEDLGNYAQAMTYYLRSNQIAEALGDRQMIGQNFNSIGVLMLNQKKYKEALKYLFKAIRLHTVTGDVQEKAYALNTIGVVYQEMQQYESAIRYLKQSLHIGDSLSLIRIQVMTYNNLGIVYQQMHQYEQSFTYFNQALQNGRLHGYTNSVITALSGLGDTFIQQKKPAEAIRYFVEALQLAQQSGLVIKRSVAYEGLAQAYAQSGLYPKAFEYQSKHTALKDSLFNQDNNQKLAQLQADYEVAKKQTEIELLKKDRQRATLLRNTLGAGLLAMLLIAGLVVSRQRLKIRNNRLLVEKSREIAQKNEELARKNTQLSEQSEQLAQINDQLSQQSAQLQEQTAKLRELDTVKSRFFANISHEFRTPLTLILGGLRDKLDQAGTTNQPFISVGGNEIKVMHRNANRLLELINQLLDLSKLESGQLQLEPKAGDFSGFLRVLAGSFSSLAESKQIAFGLQLPESPLHRNFDADKLEKIYGNLLSNAFKFTPYGGEVIMRAEAMGTEGNLLRVSVTNSGSCIPADRLDKVFDRFYQDTGHYSDQQGTGIGLALVKELVHLHKGQVYVESDAVRGTQFVVELPLSEASASQADAAQQPESREVILVEDSCSAKNAVRNTHGHCPMLLIVEDNPDLRQYIRQHLEPQYRIVESENGQRGLEAALSHLPDLIITDWMMPGMDGLTLCEKLKTDERTSHIPVVMLTALAAQESKLQGLETGADEYLTKPFEPKELQLRVRNLLESRRKLRERFSRELRLQPTDITVTSVDEKFLDKALKVVETHMSNPDFGAEEFSREIAMSRMQLHRKLTALTGQSTSDFLRTMRLKRAAQLLEGRAGNVSEVAYEVGFGNLPYFSKCFKEQFGISPSEYLFQFNGHVYQEAV